jgi:hypothetical protein
MMVNDVVIDARDGIGVQGDPTIRFEAISDTEIILADAI